MANVASEVKAEILAKVKSGTPVIVLSDALIDAVIARGSAPKIIHSDQGAEYASSDYINLASSLGIQISMSKKSSPWENGYQESFFNNLKTDLGLEFDRFNSVGELIEAIHQTINYYNQERIQTTLKTSPAKFRRTYEQTHLECLSTKPGT
jgi:transposase InsO family protein